VVLFIKCVLEFFKYHHVIIILTLKIHQILQQVVSTGGNVKISVLALLVEVMLG
jgi:hypothetical protein